MKSSRHNKSLQHKRKTKQSSKRKYKTQGHKMSNTRSFKQQLGNIKRNKSKKYRRKQKGGVMMGATEFRSTTHFNPPPKPPFGCIIL